MHMYIYGIHKKEHNTNKKFVHHFLIRNAPHFYGLPLDFCRKHIAALFAKRAAILANAPQFGKNTAFSRGNAAILGKVPESLDCGTFPRRHTFKNCSAHGGISAAHGTPH